MKKVAIIGGGFTALASATVLAENHYDVTIFEKNKELGGLAAGFKEKQWSWSLEKFYHHWFATDRHVATFLKKWGVLENIIFKNPSTVMENTNGVFARLDSALSLLLYEDLSFVNRIRLALCLGFLKLRKSWQSLENITAEKWCRYWMGKEVYQKIWQPLLKGKFGDHHHKVNMAWLWARLHVRTKKLGTYRGGFKCLIDHVEGFLKQQKCTIHKSISIEHLKVTGQNIVLNNDKGFTFDHLIVTTAPHVLKKLLSAPTNTPIYQKHASSYSLDKPFLGAVVIVFSLKQKLNQHYWYSLRKTKETPFLAVIEHTNFVSGHHYNNEHIVYVANYDTPEKIYRTTDQDYHRRAFKLLTKINPSLTSKDINKHWVFKEAYTQPIPEVGESHSLLPFAINQNPSIIHACLHHVYPWDRGTNFALELGAEAAREIIDVE